MFDFTQDAIDAGLDPSLAPFANRFVQIESGGNPTARTGKYTGLLQMGPDEIAKYGGNGGSNGLRMYADNQNWFNKKFGRTPSPTELYLTAQQGQGGLAAHLANPDAPAWQNMYSTGEGQKKGPGWAKQAIWGNVPSDLRAQFPGGVDSLTSAQFMDLWKHKVERSPLDTNLASSQGAPMNAALQSARNDKMNPLQAAMASGGGDDNQYAYAPNYDQNAGLFDRLRSGGPGALFGAPGGVFPGKDGKAGYDLGNRLQRAAIFGLAINNPSALGALGGLSKPSRKFVQTGMDEFGMPRYGFVDEEHGTVTPANMGGNSANGIDANSSGGISAAISDGKTGDELLSDPRIPAVVRSNAISMIEGSRPYPLTPKDPLAKMSVAVANAAYPGEDLTGRQAGVKDWHTKSLELNRRGGQAALHGGEAVDSFKQVANTDYPMINGALNWLDTQTGGAAPGNLKTNVTQLASELATYVGGGQISDKRFQEWADAFPVNGSDAQKRGAMAKVHQLFADSMKSLEQKRLLAVGSRLAAKQGSLLTPEMQQAMEKMRLYGAGGQQQGAPTVSNIRQIN